MTTTPLAYSIKGAAEAMGVSESHIDRLVRAGKLRAKYTSTDEDGNPAGKRVILASELERHLAGREDA